MAPQIGSAWLTLDKRHRRGLLLRMALRTTLFVVLLLAAYALLPAGGRSGALVALKLIAGFTVFLVVLVWEFRQVTSAESPALRAIEALVVAVFLVTVLFAFTYLSLSHAYPDAFNQPLGRVSAFYFTVSTLGTVGFGDIVARSNGARIAVSVQVLLDLVLLVAIARALLAAVKISASRRSGTPGAD